MLSILRILQNTQNIILMQKRAILLCDSYDILKTKTYNEVIEDSDCISSILTKYITEEHTCLGLFMDHNIHVPSIILSLQHLGHTLVFLNQSNFHSVSKEVHLKWFLSLGEDAFVEHCTKTKIFQIDGDSFILWKNKDVSDVNLSGIFCIMQTSGSTGESKIVRVPYHCIEVNAQCLRNKFNICDEDCIFWGTPLTFDPSLIEFLMAFQSGATLLIVPKYVYLNPSALYKALFCVGKITFLQMVPSVFLRWSENYIMDILISETLKTLVLGGEKFPSSILRLQRRDALQIFNIYGITEVSCWATIHEIKNETDESNISLGECLDETVFEIRNENNEPIKIGTGEMFIGSSSRICYLDDEMPENHQKFVYRDTADIVEVNKEGIFYIGRKNRIIKRFGQKINLSSIENIILQNTGLVSKCLWLQEYNKLVNFIVIEGRFDSEYKSKMLDKIRVKIINLLPQNSVPDFTVIIEKLPLTSHGKVNETGLEQIYFQAQVKDNKDFVEAFSLLWSKYLGINRSEVNRYNERSFFEIGGNSVKAIQLLSEFKEVTRSDYPDQLVTAIFEKRYIDCLECLTNVNLKRTNTSENIDHIREKRAKVEGDSIKVVWKYDLKACVDASPLVFELGDQVYIAIGAFSHIFVILDEHGKQIYKETFPDAIEGQATFMKKNSSILIGCFDGFMYSIDLLCRNIAWKYKTEDRIKSRPALCKNGTDIIFGSYDKNIYCLTMKGAERWKTTLDGRITANPIVDVTTGNIFITSVNGSCHCLNDDGVVLWKNVSQEPSFSSPCIAKENTQVVCCYVRGTICSLSIDKGELLWSYKTENFIFASPVVVEDTIIVGNENKNIYFLRISPRSCELVAKTELESRITSTCCIHKNGRTMVTACNSGKVNVIDNGNFSIIKSIQLPNEVFSSPFCYNSMIYIGCRDNNLYCLSIE